MSTIHSILTLTTNFSSVSSHTPSREECDGILQLRSPTSPATARVLHSPSPWAKLPLGRFRNQLDPAYVSFWDEYIEGVKGCHTAPSIDDVRNNPHKYNARRGPMRPIPEVGREYDLICPVSHPQGSIKIKIYEPFEDPDTPRSNLRAIYFNIHGGGWALGRAGQDADWIKPLVNRHGIVVADVDYRLAPEFPAPTADEDCWEALNFIRSQATKLRIDVGKIIVGGMSAGGTMAALLAQRAKREQMSPPIRFQILIAPPVNACIFRSDGQLDRDLCGESWLEYWDNEVMCGEKMRWYYEQYLGKVALLEKDPSRVELWKNCSPILADDEDLDGLPDAFVLSCEIDVLKSEVHEYAHRLARGGSKVKLETYKKLGHTFIWFGGVIPEARRSFEDISNVLTQIMEGSFVGDKLV